MFNKCLFGTISCHTGVTAVTLLRKFRGLIMGMGMLLSYSISNNIGKKD